MGTVVATLAVIVGWLVAGWMLGALVNHALYAYHMYGAHGLVHFLYAPTADPGVTRARWHHHLRLVPKRVLERRCRAYDRRHPEGGT